MNRARPRVLYATRGYTTHDRRFVEAAADDGWEVLYARFDGRGTEAVSPPLPAHVVMVDWLGSKSDLRDSHDHRTIQAFRGLYAEIEPDVVHAGPIPTVAYVAAAAGVRPLISMSWGSDLLHDALEPDVRDRATAALAGSDAVFVDCGAVEAAALDLGASPDSIWRFPWGVDHVAFRPSPMPSPLQPLRLLSLRSHEPLYSIETLILGGAEAAKQGAAITVTVAGGGSQTEQLKALAEHEAPTTEFNWIGHVAEPDLPALMAEHHLHVSTALSDGTSVSLLQAMASARPSIVSDIPSNREWVSENETGWLHHPGDASSLAECILDALNRRAMLEEMGAAASVQVVTRARWSRNRRRISQCYNAVSGR